MSWPRPPSCIPANRLGDPPNGARVTVAGLVILRQRPGTAKGVIFITLEDETGVVNLVVWPDLKEKQRKVVMGARLMEVRGRVEYDDDVVHVIVQHMVDANHALHALSDDMMPTVLARAGLSGGDVDYLEAHGTGTPLGDPIEVQAAAAAYGDSRDADRPLLMGSVKTNIGHLESASGAAGLIKVVLSLQHGVLPQSLHFEQPSPHIPWDSLPVRVVDEAMPWKTDGRPRRAGLSSFGFTGTNAHVLVEEPPQPEPAPAAAELSGAPDTAPQPPRTAPPCTCCRCRHARRKRW